MERKLRFPRPLRDNRRLRQVLCLQFLVALVIVSIMIAYHGDTFDTDFRKILYADDIVLQDDVIPETRASVTKYQRNSNFPATKLYDRSNSPLLNVSNRKSITAKLVVDPAGEDYTGTTITDLPTTTPKPKFKPKELQHIAFLKVHKAASSTMQNIFYRFGMKRNLSFVFTEDLNYFSHSAFIHKPVIFPSKRNFTQTHDILCNHGIFSYDAFSKFIHSDSIYIGIVRDPLQQFISAVHFYSQEKFMSGTLQLIPGIDRVKTLIRHTDRYDRPHLSLTRNSMARDFGFEWLNLNDTSEMKEYLYELDSIFETVLVVEYFDESLVLMRRYLNWPMSDILYLKNNAFRGDHVDSEQQLTLSDINMFRTRNHIDYMLYDFFLQKFWGQVDREGPDFHQEVLYFQSVLERVRAFCNSVRRSANYNQVLHIEKSGWSEEFSVSRKDCNFMRLGEISFNSVLRGVQGSEMKPPTPTPKTRKTIKIKKD